MNVSRLTPTQLLLGAIWLVGAIGWVTPSATWTSLGLYVLGSLALLAWRAFGCGEAEAVFLRGPGTRLSLLWGGVLLHLLVMGAMLGSLL